MKKLAMTILMIGSLLPTAAQAVETIVGAATGYSVGGANDGSTVFAGTAGACLKTFNAGNTKLYSVGIYRGTADESNWGAEMILANRFTAIPWFWALINAGALGGGFVNADGSTEMTPSFGVGIAASASEYLSIATYFKSYRASGAVWNREVWCGVQVHVFDF